MKFNNEQPTRPVANAHEDVKDNKEIVAKIIANVELDGIKLETTKNKPNSLLGLDWMDKLGININIWAKAT